MRILVKNNGDPIGVYRTIRAGEDPQGAMERFVHADYPHSSVVAIREGSAYAEWGEGFTNYSIVA